MTTVSTQQELIAEVQALRTERDEQRLTISILQSRLISTQASEATLRGQSIELERLLYQTIVGRTPDAAIVALQHAMASAGHHPTALGALDVAAPAAPPAAACALAASRALVPALLPVGGAVAQGPLAATASSFGVHASTLAGILPASPLPQRPAVMDVVPPSLVQSNAPEGKMMSLPLWSNGQQPTLVAQPSHVLGAQAAAMQIGMPQLQPPQPLQSQPPQPPQSQPLSPPQQLSPQPSPPSPPVSSELEQHVSRAAHNQSLVDLSAAQASASASMPNSRVSANMLELLCTVAHSQDADVGYTTPPQDDASSTASSKDFTHVARMNEESRSPLALPPESAANDLLSRALAGSLGAAGSLARIRQQSSMASAGLKVAPAAIPVEHWAKRQRVAQVDTSSVRKAVYVHVRRRELVAWRDHQGTSCMNSSSGD
eukprot:CAMPEP_0115862262 /NCGR_PEP_ID=MMETSP0287-20121206/18084_1 /TAXON_ID=412157 /ORGANISM="Chrysochromulina rotalis, Strain UIO044" /LENGTH=430 /DNA_ID=CAMNT_0003316675 /DNA_START=12 /DNA_END=1305 /DNA_ORIENTATION=-